MPRILLSIACIVSGLVSYWLFRPEIHFFEWLNISNSAILQDVNPLTFLIKNHFADTVWCIAAYLMAIELKAQRCPTFYSILLWVLPVASELLQGMGMVGGTFDLIDLFIYMFLAFIFLLTTQPMKKFQLHLIGIAAITIGIIGLVGSKASKPAPYIPIEYTEATFVLQPKQDDIFTKASLAKTLNDSDNISMVLRVPASEEDKITEAQKLINNTIYSTIEKEFAKANYIVRDRAMFAKVLEDENVSADYAKIHSSTKTDLILELVSYGDIKYNTNKFRDETGTEQTANVNFAFTGTSAEFKLVSVKDNDLVGSYTFYYTPCTDGCTYKINASKTSNKLYAIDTDKGSPYEYVAPDVLENFFKECSVRLITELAATK